MQERIGKLRRVLAASESEDPDEAVEHGFPHADREAQAERGQALRDRARLAVRSDSEAAESDEEEEPLSSARDVIARELPPAGVIGAERRARQLSASPEQVVASSKASPAKPHAGFRAASRDAAVGRRLDNGWRDTAAGEGRLDGARDSGVRDRAESSDSQHSRCEPTGKRNERALAMALALAGQSPVRGGWPARSPVRDAAVDSMPWSAVSPRGRGDRRLAKRPQWEDGVSELPGLWSGGRRLAGRGGRGGRAQGDTGSMAGRSDWGGSVGSLSGGPPPEAERIVTLGARGLNILRQEGADGHEVADLLPVTRAIGSMTLGGLVSAVRAPQAEAPQTVDMASRFGRDWCPPPPLKRSRAGRSLHGHRTCAPVATGTRGVRNASV
jgi:hypothetical protein